MIINEMTDDIERRVAEFMETNPEYKKDGTALRMSRAGTCGRQLDYELQWPLPPLKLHQMLRMERGKYLHEMWQQIMGASLGDDFTEIEQEVIREIKVSSVDDDVDVVSIPGHYDGYIVSMDAIYELKNVSEYSFQAIDRDQRPYAADLEQANWYADTRGVSSMVIHYFNASSVNSIRFHIPSNHDMALKTDEKFINTVLNARYGVLRPRPFHDATATPCHFCKFKDDCYEGFAGQVKKYTGMTGESKGHPDLYENLEIALLSNRARLECDKSEKYHKDGVIKYMMSLAVNKAKIEGQKTIEASIKIGSKNNPLVTIKEIK